MVGAYRPQFSHDPNGLTANQLIERWECQMRFLPIGCREPDEAAALIEAMVLRQIAAQVLAPRCNFHQCDMLLLGTLGKHWVKITRKLKIVEIMGMGKKGFEVHKGIFRCPTPGCVIVASPEDQMNPDLRCNKHL
jgi:hypothetical protein